MNVRKSLKNKKGFTLIELLIVIVIIGILAGVVIGVLNPIQQQNRARDGAARAALNKLALSTKSLFTSSPRSVRRAPTGVEFIKGVSNVAPTHNCSAYINDTQVALCHYQITGITLPSTCSNNYYGTGSTQCEFTYYRPSNGNLFDTFILGFKTNAGEQMIYYVYQEDVATGNTSEGFVACSAVTSYASASILAAAQTGASGACSRVD